MANSDSLTPRNALDSMLKYGAAFFAVAYALGLVKEAFLRNAYGVKLPVPLTNTVAVIGGFSVVVLCVGESVLIILVFHLVSHAYLFFLGRPAPHWVGAQVARHTQKLQLGAIASLVCGSTLSLLHIARSDLHLSFHSATLLALAGCIVNLVVCLVLIKPEFYFSSTFIQQLSLLTLIGVGLLIFATLLGVGEGVQELTKPPRLARLLIAPDAIEGLRSFGVSFPELPTATGPARPTEAINLLYSGENMYIVRTADGRIVQIKAEKVWSVALSP